jgi:hypothetical protein
MRGVITLRDVLGNLGVVLREFGPLCVVRCLICAARGQKTTFLEIALRRKSP